MQPDDKPQHHQLYHPRQYPPYGPPVAEPEEALLRHTVLPYLVLAILSFFGIWGMIEADHAQRRAGVQGYNAIPARPVFQPSEAAAYHHSQSGIDLEPSESGIRPAPVGQPLQPSAPEQDLSRDLAQLQAEIARTQRLAIRVGQQEAYAAYEERHTDLMQAVTNRSVPWKESDRADLDRRAKALQTELRRFAGQLEEIASVQL